MAWRRKGSIIVRVAAAAIVLAGLGLFFAPAQITPAEGYGGAGGFGEGGLSEAAGAEAHFCPEEDCEGLLASEIENAGDSVHCAFYDLGLERVVNAFGDASERGVDAGIVADSGIRGAGKIAALESKGIIRFDESSSDYMHNKFCVFDGKKVLVGSFNPTFNGAYRNNNNFLVIENRKVAENFEREFNEMWQGKFSGSSPKETVNDFESGYEVVFCPEDGCGDKLIEYVGKARFRIDCMFFSFTHDAVAEAMNEANEQGVGVRVVFEKRQNSKYSAYHKLDEGIEKLVDGNPYNMHNKFCVFDNEIVMAGSMNPSKHSDNDNDESVVFLRNKEIAKEYGEYFLGKWNEWS